MYERREIEKLEKMVEGKSRNMKEGKESTMKGRKG